MKVKMVRARNRTLSRIKRYINLSNIPRLCVANETHLEINFPLGIVAVEVYPKDIDDLYTNVFENVV